MTAPAGVPRTRARQLPTLASFSSLISLQIGAAFAKTLFPLVGPEGVAALRIGIAAALLGSIFRPWRLTVSRALWPSLLLYGVMIGAMNLLIYRAFLYLPVGIAISIQVIGPLGAALLASRRRIDLLWIAFATMGLMIIGFGKASGPLDPRGLAFVSAAALCWGIYVTIGGKVAKLGARAVASGMAIASAFVVPVGLFHAGTALFETRVLAVGLAVATMSSAVPFLLDIYAMKNLPRSVFGVLMSASPAASAIAGWMILDERLSATQCGGIGAITVACIGATVVSARLEHGTVKRSGQNGAEVAARASADPG